jgi:hypothetical protein
MQQPRQKTLYLREGENVQPELTVCGAVDVAPNGAFCGAVLKDATLEIECR